MLLGPRIIINISDSPLLTSLSGCAASNSEFYNSICLLQVSTILLINRLLRFQQCSMPIELYILSSSPLPFPLVSPPPPLHRNNFHNSTSLIQVSSLLLMHGLLWEQRCSMLIVFYIPTPDPHHFHSLITSFSLTCNSWIFTGATIFTNEQHYVPKSPPEPPPPPRSQLIGCGVSFYL